MNKRLNEIKAVDIMSKFAITAASELTVSDLAHLLMRFKISGVPVVSRNKEIEGIITATDLFEIMKKITQKMGNDAEIEARDSFYVKDVMTKSVFSVSAETTLLEIIKLMCEKNIHTLPVISGKEIIGIIGRRDVINAFYAEV